VGGAALLAGVAAYSGTVMTTAIEQQVKGQNDIEGIEATIIERDEGLFVRNQTYKIVLSADYLHQFAELRTVEKDFTLYLRHQYVAYPLYVTSEFQFDQSRGTLAQELKLINLAEIEHQITLHSNIALQSNKLDVQLASLDHKIDNINVNYQAINIKANSDFNLQQGQVLTQVGKFELDIKGKQQLSLSQLSTQTNFNTIEGITLFNAIKVKLDNASFTHKADQVAIALEQLNSDSSYHIADSDKVSLIIDTNIANIDFKAPNNSYVITDSAVAFRIDNIEKSAYLAAEHLSRQQESNPQAITEALMDLVGAGANGEISKLNVNVNKVNFNSQGDFVLPPYLGDKPSRELNQHVMEKLAFKLKVDISKGYAGLIGPLTPMLEQLVKQGYITKDPQGNISSTLNYADNLLTANKQPVPM